jgi:hypothetical protein
MNQSDHVGFGLFFILSFIFATWALVNANFLAFYFLNLALILITFCYYWIIEKRARNSWYWEGLRRSIKGQDLRTMWNTCENGEWLLWFAAHMIGKPGWPSHQQVVLAACQCARLALRHVEDGENRPLLAIQTAEDWANGRVPVDQVRVAGEEAGRSQHGNTAYSAAKAAEGAAWAVHAREDGGCFRMAQAASQAASEAKSASYYEIIETRGYSHKAEAHQAEKETLRRCADIARRMLSIPDEITNELPLYAWIKRWNRNGDNKRTGRMDWIPVAVSRSGPQVFLNGTEICKEKLNHQLRYASILMAIAAIVALIVALGSHPSQYYAWLRWLTCSTAIILIIRGDIQGSWKWAYALAPIGILFNPILPVYIKAPLEDVLAFWHITDVVVAMIIGVSTVLMEIDLVALKKYSKTLKAETDRS